MELRVGGPWLAVVGVTIVVRARTLQSVDMALLKYLQRERPMLKCGTLSKKETEQVNERVRQALEEAKVSKKRSTTRGAYTGRHSEVTIL